MPKAQKAICGKVAGWMGAALLAFLVPSAVAAQELGALPTTEYQASSTYSAIAIDGDTAVVGQPTPAPGMVHVLTQIEGGNWKETAQLIPTDGMANAFGKYVRVHGNLIAVSAPQTTGPQGANQGAVYTYRLGPLGWGLENTIRDVNGASGDQFGSVGLKYVGTPDTMVVSAAHASVLGASLAGIAYVFTYNGSGWVQGQAFTGSGQMGAQLGTGTTAIDENGNIYLAEENGGAPSPGPGTLYIYTNSNPSSGSGWTPLGSPIQSPFPAPNDLFGGATSFGGWLFVGALGTNGGSGAVYVYSQQSDGTWQYANQVLMGNADLMAGDQFGTGLNFRGGDLLVGAPFHTVSGLPFRSGAVYEYMLNGGQFQLRKLLTAPDPAVNGNFGARVRLSATTVTALIEAPGPNASGTFGAYFFGPLTPAGPHVNVPGPRGATGSLSSVTFGSITGPGATNVTIDQTCPTLPNGFIVGTLSGTSCLTISTTATYSSTGGINVCIPAPPQTPGSVATVVQCDPAPSPGSCPSAGMDPLLTTPQTDPQGYPVCCGDVSSYVTTAPGADPVCLTTHGLSMFGAVTKRASTAAVPALGQAPLALLAFALAVAAFFAVARRRAQGVAGEKRAPIESEPPG
jgi:hypothetical protein